ncbi:MAG: DUF6142 family protein [Clostridiales bacterium]|nr:DUF6142 family protein [Clostridiales bacterium]
MSKSRRDYFRRTRKVRMRDLSPSKSGWTGLICGLASVLLFWISVIFSFLDAGDAQVYVGGIGLIGIVLSVGAIVMGFMGTREEGSRPAAPRVSIALGVIMTVLLVGLYIYGL